MTTPALNILPIDLLHFSNSVLIAANTDGGFGLDDVERVEKAWEIADAMLVSHGYIVVQGDAGIALVRMVSFSVGRLSELSGLRPTRCASAGTMLQASTSGFNVFSCSECAPRPSEICGRSRLLGRLE
jgi:hypothetical protein